MEIVKELYFQTSRSSGAGGQHVNKTETKVELYFDINHSSVLTGIQKDLLFKKLANRINKEGVLILSADRERSQSANRKTVIAKFYDIVRSALIVNKKRLATKPSRASKEKRLKKKKIHSERKRMRRME